ncbi:hypothetical protein GIB67_014678 [Kingdonia uniflora]|uniref:Uncharacterized protein n=1 Tax=Kingdonia uniflora TaxID=39325 RepID=A0A7J7LY79_9MAGN|nr:hypothetical protein GIB67_014678 [Kingdonia uniflora]
MAAKKKESEGIALLSMYYDEEEDDAEDMEEDDIREEKIVVEEEEFVGTSETFGSDSVREYTGSPYLPSLSHFQSSPQNEESAEVTQVLDYQRVTTHMLNIVDYGHDEAALSPDVEFTNKLVGYMYQSLDWIENILKKLQSSDEKNKEDILAELRGNTTEIKRVVKTLELDPDHPKPTELSTEKLSKSTKDLA